MCTQNILRIFVLISLSATVACGNDSAIDDSNRDNWRADAPRDPNPTEPTDPTDPTDPAGETRDDAVPAEVGQPVDGELAGDNSESWFRFVAGSAYAYVIYTTGSLDTECALFETARNEPFAEDDDSGDSLNCRLQEELVDGASYAVRVRSFQERSQGSFQLHIDAIDATPVDPQIAARPGEVRAGGLLTVGGSGFTANGSVSFEISGMGEIVVEDATADADGIVATNIDISPDQALGRYQVRANDNASNTPSRWINFSVIAGQNQGNNGEVVDAGNGGSFEAVVAAGQVDSYRLNVDRSGEWTIHTTGTTDVVCTLVDDADAVVATNDDGGEGTNCRIVQELVAPGVFTINVRHFRNNAEGPYTLVITPPQAGGNNGNGDGVIDAGNGGSFEGVIAVGQTDSYRLNVNRDGEWIINTTGTTDTHCTLIDDAGNEVVANDDGGEGTNCRIAQELQAPATYIINVRHFRNNAEGPYTLVITPPEAPIVDGGNNNGQDDHADQIQGASLLLPIIPSRGAFDKDNDQDWFVFLAPVTGLYTFTTIGFADTVCTLFDSEGNQLTRDDNSGILLNCEIQRTLQAGSIYYLSITEGRLRIDNSYVLVAAPPGENEDDHGNDLIAANFVDDHGVVAGNFEQGGDVDVVKFRATRSGPYQIETVGALDTICRLLDSNGNELATNDDGGDALNCRITRDLIAGEVYAFSVRAFSDQVTGAYQMSLSLPAGNDGPPR